MIDNDTQVATQASARRWGAAAALIAAGLAGGMVLAGTVSANAATSTPTPSSSASSGTLPGPDQPAGPRPGETLLTGATADKVKAAVLATYADATVLRLETDKDGAYEAHLITTAGKHLVVTVDKAFTVTGSQELTGRGPGMGHGDGPGAPAPSGTAGSSTAGSSSSTGAASA
jgi:hypothetical protein